MILAATLTTPTLLPSSPSFHEWGASNIHTMDRKVDDSEFPRPETPAPHDELACGFCQLMNGTALSQPFIDLPPVRDTFVRYRAPLPVVLATAPLQGHHARAPPVE